MVCSDSNMSDPFEIIVGTYEQYMLGYKVNNIVNVSERVSLLSFCDSHLLRHCTTVRLIDEFTGIQNGKDLCDTEPHQQRARRRE